ncbi:unnamed protein product, partial [Adineta ricciae]
GNINNSSKDCQNTITQLRRVVNDVNTYTDGDNCIHFIETITDRKACMIISGALGQHIVRRVHHMSQVDSIFIFCGNKKYHEQWAREWPKIKGVFTEITPICEALKQAAWHCERNAMPMSFMKFDKKLDQLDPSFMYTQILKEILLTITFNQEHIEKYLDYCRKALTERLHQEQKVTETFTVFRGQGLPEEGFEELKETKGGLMSFNNFLSTSKNRSISLDFAKRAMKNPDLIGILFVMKIDPGQSTTAFASVSDISAVSSEDEILFSINSVFRVLDLKPIDKSNTLYEVTLTLTSDSD